MILCTYVLGPLGPLRHSGDSVVPQSGKSRHWVNDRSNRQKYNKTAMLMAVLALNQNKS